MTDRLGRIRREFLGLNRRNHDLLFRRNPRARWHLVDDKLATKAVLEPCGVPTPSTLATWTRQGELARLPRVLESIGPCVLKPARGHGGAGIHVLVERTPRGFRKASGATLDWPDLAVHAADVLAGVFSGGGREDVLVAERIVVAHPALAALAHGGVPDLRIVVYRGVPVMAMLRLPTRRSDGRANLHLGGLGVGVDLDTGRTTTAIAGRRAVTSHPDHGRPLRGTAVPAWDELLRLACRAADAVGLGYVGVDLVVDAALGPLVLELNARPGLAVQFANRAGLRPRLAVVDGAALPAGVEARVVLARGLGQSLASS